MSEIEGQWKMENVKPEMRNSLYPFAYIVSLCGFFFEWPSTIDYKLLPIANDQR